MITLASGSETRATLLRNAQIEFRVKKPSVDEREIAAALQAEGASTRDIADTLAEYKARQVALNDPSIVLASDQILDLDGQVEMKVSTRDDAIAKLQRLQGKAHKLISAAVIYENHEPVWRNIREVRLVMRPLTDQQIADYLDVVGEDVFYSVGCYHYEEYGAHLFTRVEGDYFSLLGLPLVEVLGFLRTRGIGL